jgi:hypothetical protein
MKRQRGVASSEGGAGKARSGEDLVKLHVKTAKEALASVRQSKGDQMRKWVVGSGCTGLGTQLKVIEDFINTVVRTSFLPTFPNNEPEALTPNIISNQYL